jgi:hypothetical protein
MAIQYINTGTSPNAGNGDTLRLAFTKINHNFRVLSSTTASTLVNGSYTLALSTSGQVLLNGTLFRGYTGSAGGGTTGNGYTGSAGADGVGYAGSRGDLGYVGSQGNLGYAGSAGTNGTSVRIVGSVENSAALASYNTSGLQFGDGVIQTDTGHLQVWSGISFSDVGQIKGDLGYTGSIGYTGSSGADSTVPGYVGSQGDLGYVGSSGAISGTIIQSDTAPTSPTETTIWYDTVGGRSYVYYDDSWVDANPQTNGYTGSEGGIGYIGSEGGTGYIGSQGGIGYVGSEGGTGYVGSQGGAGYTGSTGADSTVRGYTGSQGDQGLPGANGTSVRIINLVANAVALAAYNTALLNSGDGIIQEDTGHLQVWTGNQFTDVGQVKGNPGFTGSQGDIGYTGSTGADSTVPGYVGSRGDIGYVGSEGGTGYTGSTGADSTVPGYTGSQGRAMTLISDTPPSGQTTGTFWYSSITGRTYINFQDSWVDANPTSTGYTGSTGADSTVPGYTGSTGADSTVPGYTGSSGVVGYTGSGGGGGGGGGNLDFGTIVTPVGFSLDLGKI